MKTNPPKHNLGDRVIMTLVWAVVVLILTEGAVLVILALFRPDADLSGAGNVMSNMVNALVGAIIGYLAGTRQHNEPRDPNPPDPPTE